MKQKAFVIKIDFVSGITRHDVVFGDVVEAGLHASAMHDRADVKKANIWEGPLFLDEAEAKAISSS